MAKWLRLALAEDMDDGAGGGRGIAAGLYKPLLLWRLMRPLPDVMAGPAYALLRCFLARDADLRKRFQLAECLADLFDQYQVYRADWLAAWVAGYDVLIKVNGERRPLSDEQRWPARVGRRCMRPSCAGSTNGPRAANGPPACRAG